MKCPGVTVGIAEVGLPNSAAQITDFGHANSVAKKRRPNCLKVVDDQVQAVHRWRIRVSHSIPEDDRASRVGRSQLHYPHSVARLDVVVEDEADLVDLNGLNTVDIGRA